MQQMRGRQGSQVVSVSMLPLPIWISKKKKVTLSIKLLEEIEKKEALEKYGTSEGSGKSLPFSTLAADLKKKDKKKE